jgi:uncharacterized membrane protein YkvA (DUF1232 family)
MSPMPIRTVADLKRVMKDKGVSPERLGEATNISNMTLRRLLKKYPTAKIPTRYQVQLDFYEMGSPAIAEIPSAGHGQPADFEKFQPLIKQLEDEGSKLKDITGLKRSIRSKLADRKLHKTFFAQVQSLVKATTETGKRTRALAVGALLYFINPFDLIPDAVVGIGYLDDFAVVSLVSALVLDMKRSKV